MAVSNELMKPDTEDDFEAMCHSLYRRMWNDSSCSRVGGQGQSQFGIDIIGHDGKKTIGIQCKHYNKKAFTISTVTNDVALADAANLEIGHMLFATTAANKSGLVLEVLKLSEERRRKGKFTVSVDFWEEISGHLRIYPEVGRAYVRNFPGAAITEIQETSRDHFRLYKEDREVAGQFQAQVIDEQKDIAAKLDTLTATVSARLGRVATPEANGDEADPRVVVSLNVIRDRIREGKSADARSLLDALGDPSQFKDTFSRFRWQTNQAAIELLEGRNKEAALAFLNAFDLAPEHEKALINRTHAYILLKDVTAADNACQVGLEKFPQSAALWALKLNIRMLQGDADPERDLPEALQDTSDILYTRAHLAERRGETQKAIGLFRRSLQKDPASFDVKRAYLASALIWADQDPVLAHHGQLSENQRAALEDAVAQMEPIEQSIPAIQSEHISLEVTTNIASALMLLGQSDRGRAFTAASLRRHPLAEGLLRIRLDDLEEHQNLAEIHSLTDHILNELAPSVLGTLVEISANHGELEWYTELMRAAESSGMDPERLQVLNALSVQALWMAGKHQEAIEAAEKTLLDDPEQMLPRIILGNILRRLGRRQEALQQADICNDRISVGSQSLEIMHVAQLYYWLEQYHKAAGLFAKLVKTPGNDEFTKKWLICLIESDQRRRAQEVIDQLPSPVRALPTFIRIEVNLARRTGNWGRIRELLSVELARAPNDSGIAIGFVGALHRLGYEDELQAYLSSDPDFQNAPLEDQFELAKYQEAHGHSFLALQRLYRLFRAHPGNSQVAGYYLAQVLIGKPTEALDPPLEVQRGTLVQLRTAAETRSIAIDFEDISDIESWPELVSPSADISTSLMGKKVGESVHLPGIFGGGSAEIIALESIFAFAAKKGQILIANAAVPAGPLWSVKLIKDDGELNIEPLLESARQRKAQVGFAFDNYSQHRFPLAMLAKLIGTDPVTLVTEWPHKHASLFVSIGTHEERNAASEILKAENRRYVFDLLTIAELVRRKAFEPVIHVLGTPIVPQTLREHLLILQQLAAGPRGSALIGEANGNLQVTETPADYYDQRERLLNEILADVDKYCEVVPTLGPQEVTELHRTLAQAVDADTLDSLYLAAERNAVLVSEDGALRLLSPNAGVQTSIGIQPILIEACSRGFLNTEDYANLVVDKLFEGHDFVSVRSEDLLAIGKRTPGQVADGVMLAFESFRKPSLDIISGVQVTTEFLRHAVHMLEPITVAKYGQLALDVLKYGRPELADDIHRAIAASLQEINTKRRKLNVKERRLFDALLAAPALPRNLPRLRPIPQAIRRILKQ